jgi:hypothetical protein
MLRHVAVFTWNPETTEDDKARLASGLAALPGQIPEIRAYVFGPDARLGNSNADFAVVADFDDAAAYARYADHPAHQALLAELLRPILAERHSVQVAMGADRRKPDMSSAR